MGAPAITPVDINGLAIIAGGQSTVSVPASAAAVVVKSTPGRLCRVLVTATGAAAMSIFDHASAASGTIIGQLPANPAVGSVYDFGLPAANGIVVGGSATNPVVTISWL